MSTPIDGVALLRKYMQHVADIEDCDYVTGGQSAYSSVEFTPEEWAALQACASELSS